MCGRACTTRTRAAARARIVAGRVGYLPSRLGRSNDPRPRAGRASSECGVARRSWLEGVAMEVQVATDASAATQAFALG